MEQYKLIELNNYWVIQDLNSFTIVFHGNNRDEAETMWKHLNKTALKKVVD